jgi:hypothetical protein
MQRFTFEDFRSSTSSRARRSPVPPVANYIRSLRARLDKLVPSPVSRDHYALACWFYKSLIIMGYEASVRTDRALAGASQDGSEAEQFNVVWVNGADGSEEEPVVDVTQSGIEVLVVRRLCQNVLNEVLRAELLPAFGDATLEDAARRLWQEEMECLRSEGDVSISDEMIEHGYPLALLNYEIVPAHLAHVLAFAAYSMVTDAENELISIGEGDEIEDGGDHWKHALAALSDATELTHWSGVLHSISSPEPGDGLQPGKSPAVCELTREIFRIQMVGTEFSVRRDGRNDLKGFYYLANILARANSPERDVNVIDLFNSLHNAALRSGLGVGAKSSGADDEPDSEWGDEEDKGLEYERGDEKEEGDGLEYERGVEEEGDEYQYDSTESTTANEQIDKRFYRSNKNGTPVNEQIDKKTQNYLKGQLKEIDKQIGQLDKRVGQEEIEELKSKRKRLNDYLNAAVTRTGTRRSFRKSDVEKVKYAVGRNIERAIDFIEKRDLCLASHLRESLKNIHSGRPEYRPKDDVYSWQVEIDLRETNLLD